MDGNQAIQTNCPKCNSQRLEYQQEYGYWGCLDCGKLWGLDADDPDYDEESIYCFKCGGDGWITIKGAIYACQVCNGSGWIWI